MRPSSVGPMRAEMPSRTGPPRCSAMSIPGECGWWMSAAGAASTLRPGQSSAQRLSPEWTCRRLCCATRRRRRKVTPQITFRQGDAAATGQPDRCADIVFERALIHHLSDRLAAFREAHRLLAPGGVPDRAGPHAGRHCPARRAGAPAGLFLRTIPTPFARSKLADARRGRRLRRNCRRRGSRRSQPTRSGRPAPCTPIPGRLRPTCAVGPAVQSCTSSQTPNWSR